ncbi:FecR family protein [Mucilaginibacter sp. SJ]|uniref:FecR family protein n=1 Tax=Mucilaginibacter sp. SJ TaxID=3029053 RepID=UPI0023A9C323|nr:FecR domain-containing protein [Mucilaginibacter sp. SJ]WEA00647.1 FecR domain-containing protein [Mucilaginibacter sp. SJ]
MNNSIPELIDKFFDGKCTAEDMLRLDEWYYSYDTENDPDELMDELKRHAFEIHMLERINDNISKVECELQEEADVRGNRKINWMPWAISGIAAMLMIATGLYFLWPSGLNAIKGKGTIITVAPPQNKLMLTMSDGKLIYLDTGIKELRESDGTEIRIKDNTITYTNNACNNTAVRNTLSIPAGRTYRINFSDGTVAWLNNVSELTYPVIFSKSKDRIVKLKGEAYFEVFHDAARPFKVKMRESEITVLGTKFNVNTFNKDGTTTTLLEGSVKVASHGNEGILKPGQQAVTGKTNINIKNADLQKVIAWKDGYFHFKEDGIETILEQVARWYNVEVKYLGPINVGMHYGGKIPRSKSLNEVLTMLTDITGLKFKRTGTTLWVYMK